MGDVPRLRARLGARRGAVCDGVGVAGRRRRAARVLGQRRHLRRRAASRHHDIALGASSAIRAPVSGEVTFAGRLPTNGLTVTIAAGDYKTSLHSSGGPPRSARCQCGGGRCRRRAWPVWRGGVRPPVRSSRYPGRRERELRRPTRTASASRVLPALPPAPEAPPAPLPQPAPAPPVAASPPAPAPRPLPLHLPPSPLPHSHQLPPRHRSGCRTARIVWRACRLALRSWWRG